MLEFNQHSILQSVQKMNWKLSLIVLPVGQKNLSHYDFQSVNSNHFLKTLWHCLWSLKSRLGPLVPTSQIYQHTLKDHILFFAYDEYILLFSLSSYIVMKLNEVVVYQTFLQIKVYFNMMRVNLEYLRPLLLRVAIGWVFISFISGSSSLKKLLYFNFKSHQ